MRVVAQAGHGDNFHGRQRLFQLLLRFGRHDGTGAAQYVDGGALDFADILPEFGGHETFHQVGVALPDYAAVFSETSRLHSPAVERVLSPEGRARTSIWHCKFRVFTMTFTS